MFKIKNVGILNAHPTLEKIALDIYKKGFDIITSAYRPGDDGCHGTIPLRALDFRCSCSNLELGETLAKFVNDRWIYDPERPDMKVAIFHNVGRGFHLHIQVHPNTTRLQ